MQVETKNAEDSDKEAIELLATTETITLTAGTITKFEAGANLDSANQGMQELVRFVYILTAQTGTQAWVHFRMLNPSWLSN